MATDDPTIEQPAIEAPTAENRQVWEWTTSQLRTRFDALTPVNTRRAQGVDAAEARTLVDDAIATIVGYARALQVKVDAHERLMGQHRQLLVTHRALTERLEAAEGQEQAGPPTMAVDAIDRGQRAAEHTADVIVAQATRDAELIRANAEEEARAIRATAQLDRGDLARPEPGSGPDGALAEIQWLAAALPAAEADERAAHERVEELRAEAGRWAQILPLAREALPVGVLDVTEVAS